MSWIQAFTLGLVQGLTEFLPISSSGHLALLPWFFGWKDPGLAFSVFLHLGTVCATFIYFFRDWSVLLQAGFRSIIERRIGFERERILFWCLVVGSVPAALAGLLLHDFAENEFRSSLVIAVALAVVGFLLYWIDGKSPSIKGLEEIKGREAIWIGIAQAFAIVPGVSRSGATMTMGRLLGYKREDCARFSFLLALPIILGASAYEWKAMTTDMVQEFPVSYLITGFVTSFVSGLLAIHGLLLWLRKTDFRLFAWYRIALAALVVLLSLMGKV